MCWPRCSHDDSFLFQMFLASKDKLYPLSYVKCEFFQKTTAGTFSPEIRKSNLQTKEPEDHLYSNHGGGQEELVKTVMLSLLFCKCTFQKSVSF